MQEIGPRGPESRTSVLGSHLGYRIQMWLWLISKLYVNVFPNIWLLCERSQAEISKWTLSAIVCCHRGPRANVESAFWGITTHYPYFLPISWLLYSHVRATNDSCAGARNGSAVLWERFAVIIVCLSTRLNELLLCCILAITMALIVRTPCGTIKIPSESPICLPAMPAVHVPFLGLRQSRLMLCIIHKLPDNIGDLPGDSRAWESSRMRWSSGCPVSWILNWLSDGLWPLDQWFKWWQVLFWSGQQGKNC